MKFVRTIITTDQEPMFLDWFNKALNAKIETKDARWITHVAEYQGDRGPVFELLAVVVFNQFNHKGNCEISIVSNGKKRWCTKEFVKSTFFYVFHTLKCRRIYSVAEVTNLKSIKIIEQVGMTREAELKDWFRVDGNGIMHRFTFDEYESSPWYREKSW